MLYCFDNRLPFDYSTWEMEVSKLNGSGILYDNVENVFTDFNHNIIDIAGKLIFPRTGITQIYDMNQEIINHKAIPILTNEQIEMIMNWPKYYHPNRRMQILKGKDLINYDTTIELASIYGDQLFIKTKNKNFSGVIPITLLQDQESAFYKALSYHLDEDFIVSEKVDIVKDTYGKKEYRCFIMNDEVYNISRLTTEVYHSIEPSVLEKLQEIIQTIPESFPKYYVVDLFEYQTESSTNIDVVEFNPIHSSGLYLYNSVLEKSKDLLHSDVTNVASEFMVNKQEYRKDGALERDASILYEIANSFAYDLRSICLTGKLGLCFSTYSNLSVSDFARHKPIYDFENMIPLTDEDLFVSEEDMVTDLENEGLSKDMIDNMQKLLKLNKNY